MKAVRATRVMKRSHTTEKTKFVAQGDATNWPQAEQREAFPMTAGGSLQRACNWMQRGGQRWAYSICCDTSIVQPARFEKKTDAGVKRDELPDRTPECESILFLEPWMNVRSVQHCVSRRRETNTNTDYN